MIVELKYVMEIVNKFNVSMCSC